MGLKPTTPRPDQMCPLRGVAVPRYPKTSSLADRPCGIPKFLINRVVRHSAAQLFSYFVFSWRRPMILITNNPQHPAGGSRSGAPGQHRLIPSGAAGDQVRRIQTKLVVFKRTTQTYPPLSALERGGGRDYNFQGSTTVGTTSLWDQGAQSSRFASGSRIR